MNNYTVYMHISPSNKRYIGITCNDVNRRWQNGSGYKTQPYFYNAIKRYGWDNFQHIIVAKGLDEETAKWLEIELIREWNTTNQDKGYNITQGGEGHRGHNPLDSMTEEAKKERGKKISIALSGENNPNYGKNPLEGKTEEELKEIRKRQSEAISGKKCYWYNKHHSNESKKKMSDARKGKYNSKNSPVAKSVICLTTKRIFYTTVEAGKYYNCQRGNISSCCKKKAKSCGKLQDGTPLTWRYLTYKHNKKLRPVEYQFKK